MLKEVKCIGTNRPVLHFLDMDELDLNPPYQRVNVWNAARRLNLIRSLLIGLPIGSIYINLRSQESPTFTCIDGKQRIETLRLFTTGQFSIPRAWLNSRQVRHEKEHLVWNDLSDGFMRQFCANTIMTYTTTLLSIDREEELYNLINCGGVPHEDS